MVWIEFGPANRVYQCRIGDVVYRSEGRLILPRIVWDTIWPADSVTVKGDSLVLSSEFGRFAYVRSVSAMDKQCERPVSPGRPDDGL